MAKAPAGSGRKTAMRRRIGIAFIGVTAPSSLRMWNDFGIASLEADTAEEFHQIERWIFLRLNFLASL